jgi:hypothetical protein
MGTFEEVICVTLIDMKISPQVVFCADGRLRVIDKGLNPKVRVKNALGLCGRKGFKAGREAGLLVPASEVLRQTALIPRGSPYGSTERNRKDY